MDFLINLLIKSGFDASSPWSVFVFLVTRIGFVFIIFAILKGLADVWLNWRQDKYAANLKWIFLAIDVPRLTEQSPKAVEQIFNQIWGSLGGANFVEKWWKGKFMNNFSFELVSIGGYIQYVVRTPEIFRDLVEAAIYAQYPEAQISEIEDYTQSFSPENFKEKGYDLWGAQFELVNDEVYPIKTYSLFEHSIAQAIVDPQAALLEIFSRFKHGEQGWLQINVLPVKDDWKEKSEKEVKKLLGKKIEEKKTQIDKVFDASASFAGKLADTLLGGISGAIEEKKEEPWKMLDMTAGERGLIEALERKAEKTGFKVKIRYIYIAPKEIFSKPRGVSGVTGAFKQFALLNSNAFKPDSKTATKVDYFRTSQRTRKLQKKILKNYKERSQEGGTGNLGYILNTEELASIYHFPHAQTIAPTVHRAEAKRGEAPFGLPVYEETEIIKKESTEISNNFEKKSEPAEDLPV